MEQINIKLSNYKGLKIKKNKLEIKEEEIKKALDYLQNSRAKVITVNRPAKQNDLIEIDFEVRQGGVKIENGESKNHPLILGEQRFLPGFEKEIEGMKAGEEKEFSLKAPENWPDKRIANKNMDFKVKMNLVQERELSKINDEFAKSLGEFKSLDALKGSIKEGLMKEKEQKEKERIRIELIEKVAQDSKIDVPDVLIKQELEKMINELKASISSMGLDFDKYLKDLKTTIEDLKKDWQDQAEKRVQIALCLGSIADKENIEVNDEDIKERIDEDLKRYPNAEEVKKNIDLSALKEYTKAIIRNEKVFDLLEREANIK